MKLSESLRKRIIAINPGKIISTFKAKPRRYVIFFEELLAEYIKACEDNGEGPIIDHICRDAIALVAVSIAPKTLRKLPFLWVLNKVARNIWISIGGADDVRATRKGNTVTVAIQNGMVTRYIGSNHFTTGLLNGILTMLSGKQVIYAGETSNGGWHEYHFTLTSTPWEEIVPKDKALYDQQNFSHHPTGFDLKDALRRGTISMKGNRLSFRGKSLVLMENTFFHLLSQRSALDHLSTLSFRFFSDLVSPHASQERKLLFLKTMLQFMGWGHLTSTRTPRSLVLTLRHLPFGLQREQDNWLFIAKVIEGYVRLVDPALSLSTMTTKGNLTLHFSS